MIPWQELSRKEWGNVGDMDGNYPGTAEIAIGLGQRIAAALERIADAVDPEKVEANEKRRRLEEYERRRYQLIDKYRDQWDDDWTTITTKVREFLDVPAIAS
jgi:aldehyde:ferredoxin oxidoreductase